MTRATLLSILAALGACAPDVPATPSFQQDVLPILAANCVRCHGAPAIGGAPEYLRFDTFDDVVLRARTLPSTDPACAANNPSPDPGCFDEVVIGAASNALNIAARVANDDRPMPPRFPLDAWQLELLDAWATQGGGRGEPRPDNHAPTAAIVTLVQAANTTHLELDVDDVDRDVVGGALYAELATGEVALGLLASGRSELAWDTTGVAPGSYPLRARLDDGARLHVVELGFVTVGGP